MKRMIQLSMTLAVLLFLPLTVSAQKAPDRAGFDGYGVAVGFAGGAGVDVGTRWVYTTLSLDTFYLTNFIKTDVTFDGFDSRISLPSLDIDPFAYGRIECLITPQQGKDSSYSAVTNKNPKNKIRVSIESIKKYYADYSDDIGFQLNPGITDMVTGEFFYPSKRSIKIEKLKDGSTFAKATFSFKLSKKNLPHPLVLSISKKTSSPAISILHVNLGLPLL